jgi:hypothetical protein
MVIEGHGEAAGRLGILTRVLSHWISVNKDMARFWGWADCPWWCNEEASVSTLAGAIWKAGGMALEDYSDEKTYGRSRYQGRCDLYFTLRSEEFVLEAKQCWQSVNARDEAPSRVLERELSAACTDVRRGTARGVVRLGAVFVAPYVSRTRATTLRECLSS